MIAAARSGCSRASARTTPHPHDGCAFSASSIAVSASRRTGTAGTTHDASRIRRVDRHDLARGFDCSAVDRARRRTNASARRIGDRSTEALAHAGATELGDRFVAEPTCRSRGDGGGRLVDRRFDQFLEVTAFCESMPEERFVRGVLEQPPDEVRHPRNELTDRRVRPDAQAQLAQRGMDGLGHPVQQLDLDRRLVESDSMRGGDRVCDRTDVVRRERRSDRPRVADHERCAPLVVRVGRSLRARRPEPAIRAPRRRSSRSPSTHL